MDEERVHAQLETKYECKDCHMLFCTTGIKRITNCIQCNSNNLESTETSVTRRPYIIPFQKSIKDAESEYEKKTKWNPFLPWKIHKKEILHSMQTIYIPAYYTNVNYKGEISFYAMDKKNQPTSQKFEVVSKINFDYKNIIETSTTVLEDKIWNTLGDYDMEYAQNYDSNILENGVHIEPNIEPNQVAEKIQDKVSKNALGTIRKNIQHELKKLNYNHANIRYDNTTEILVPMYILLVNKNQKQYKFFMNGQNGKSIMIYPIGRLETILLCAGIFVIIFLCSFLISYFL